MNEEQQTTEVTNTTQQQGNTEVQRQTVNRDATVSSRTLIARAVWFIVGFILIVIALRIVLLLLGANQGNGFVDVIYALGGFFAAPFFGIFSYEPAYGVSVFEISSVVAILVYALIGWGIAKLVTIGSTQRDI